MTPIDQYIYKQTKEISEVLDFLNDYIQSVDQGIKTSIKWKVPYYTRRQSLCYLNVLKSGKVELNFLKGYLFSPSKKHYLQFRNRTVVGGITYESLEDIDVQNLETAFKEAIRLDD